MIRTTPDIIPLLIKSLKGSCSEEELQQLQLWINGNPDNQRFFDELSDIWQATAKKDQDLFDANEALKKVKQRLGKKSPVITLNAVPLQTNKRVFNTFLKVAAVFALAYGMGILSYYVISSKNIVNNTITEIKAPIGSKSQVTLPDGTKVWLNSGSTLRYDAAFNQAKREVTLEGEAFFDVTKKKGKLFLVKTKDITIRVLGTAFNVKAYPNEGAVATTLVRGSLIVEQNTKGKEITQTVLKPNQRATFVKNNKNLYLSEKEDKFIKQEVASQKEKTENLEGQVLLSKDVDTKEFTAWKDNCLIFKNETFESLTIKLERWYGVKINITNDEIKKFHFNGTIVNETINDVMEIIGYTLPIRYSIQHNIITIQKKTY